MRTEFAGSISPKILQIQNAKKYPAASLDVTRMVCCLYDPQPRTVRQVTVFHQSTIHYGCLESVRAGCRMYIKVQARRCWARCTTEVNVSVDDGLTQRQHQRQQQQQSAAAESVETVMGTARQQNDAVLHVLPTSVSCCTAVLHHHLVAGSLACHLSILTGARKLTRIN